MTTPVSNMRLCFTVSFHVPALPPESQLEALVEKASATIVSLIVEQYAIQHVDVQAGVQIRGPLNMHEPEACA